MVLGPYPAFSIAQAREWASELNLNVEKGIDPRALKLAEEERDRMTVAAAHKLYMQAVREGRASRAKKKNRPRTIADKEELFARDIPQQLKALSIYDVAEQDLTKLVLVKGRTAKTAANRLISELKVFFGWASSLRGTEVGLTTNPAARLADLRFPETPRSRSLSLDEIGWFLRALVPEPRKYQRGFLLSLLAATRISELRLARSDELLGDMWTIPPERSKNHRAHKIALGEWGVSLFLSNSEWVFPSNRIDGPTDKSGWYNARNRIVERMSELSGRPIARFTPHDLRRTARSNTKRLETDYETAEAMLNHAKQGLERIYDNYDLETEKRDWFLKWEAEIIRIARINGVAAQLGVPDDPQAMSKTEAIPAWRRRHGRANARAPTRRQSRMA
jgi:integrase